MPTRSLHPEHIANEWSEEREERIEDAPSANVALVRQALNDALRDVVEVHKHAGLPMVDWQDGKVVLVSAEEVEARLNSKKSRRRKS